MKKNVKTLSIIFSVALNTVFMGLFFYHQSGLFPLKNHQTDHNHLLYEALDLTRAQRDRFSSAGDRLHGFIRAQGRRTKAMRLELIDLLASKNPDREAIDTKQKEIQTLQRQTQTRVIDHLLEESGMLRPEQRQKFFALIKKRIEKSSNLRPRWMPQRQINRSGGAQR